MKLQRNGSGQGRLVAAAPHAIIGLALAGAAPIVVAQQAASDAGLEEIVVTAERSRESLQSVPISATVISSESLISNNVNNITDLQRLAPSVNISNIGRSTAINIRGVGLSQTSPTGSPGVAYYVDGVLIPHENTILGSFYDIDSVEVLRGPQGTLSGQNSTGGALYVRTPDPKLSEWGGYLDQTAANSGWLRTQGALNIPLGSMFALRVAGIYDRRDSFTTNVGPGDDPGNVHYVGGRGDLLFQPIDQLKINLRMEYGRSDTDNFAYKPLTSPRGVDAFTISEDADSYNRQYTRRWDAEIRYDVLPSLQVRWQSSHAQNDNADLSDADRSAIAPLPPFDPIRGLGGATTHYSIWIHELDLVSQGDGPLHWLAGLFYLKDRNDTQLLGWADSYVTPVTPLSTNLLSTTDTSSKSVFGQATYEFAPSWKAILGARYSKDHQGDDRSIAPAPFLLGNSVAESNAVTGKTGFEFTPTANSLYYLTVSKGYKAGGNNLAATDPSYKPEKNVVEELGSKLTFFSNRLRVNGDIFFTQYDNIQVQSGHFILPMLPVLFPITQNTGKARSEGLELEAAAVLGGWHLDGGIAYLHSVTKGTDTLLNETTSEIGAVVDGTTLPFAPRWTANAGVEYRWNFGDNTIAPRAMVSYLSSRYVSLFPSDQTLLDSRALLDVTLSWSFASHYRIEGFATNLTNKTYISSLDQGGTSALGGFMYGAPRQYGARIRVSY